MKVDTVRIGVTEIRAYDNPACRSVDLYIRQAGCDTVITFEDVEAGKETPWALRLELEEAMELMESLWSCGIRPHVATEITARLEAVERHLEDMRALAFETLRVKKPEPGR